MKCIVCHGEEIVPADVFEELEVGSDIIRVPVTVLQCQSCGERYYDRALVRRLESVREEITTGRTHVEQVGKVLQVRRT